jgi:hypothetical protein
MKLFFSNFSYFACAGESIGNQWSRLRSGVRSREKE